MGTPYPIYSLNQVPQIRLISIGWFDCGPGEWELRHALNANWTYYCNDRDGASIFSGGDEIPLQAQRLVLIPGGCRFDSSCNAQVRHLFGYFAIPGLLHHRFDQLHRPLTVPLGPEQGILHELLALAGTMPTPEQSLRLAACLGQGLTQVLPQEIFATADPQVAAIAPACALIDARYDESVSIAELAAACRLSVNTFMRHFRVATGTTPAQALRARRVQAAAQLLENSDESLDRIAEVCGFPNRTYLTRVFQAVVGIPPSTHRKLRQAKSAPARCGTPGEGTPGMIAGRRRL